MKSNYIYFLLIIFLASCYSTYNSTKNIEIKSDKKEYSSKTKYYVDTDNDGNYEPITLEEDKKPQPVQGKLQWMREISKYMKYPPMARRDGIQGEVVLIVDFDESGKITDIKVKKSLSKECDEAAQNAFIHATQKGYKPLFINGIPAKFRIEFPMKFYL